MTDDVNDGKRDFLRTAAVLGATGGFLGAALAPREALAQFDLDDAGYHEVASAWAAAMDKDPAVARTIAAGLAKRLQKDPTIPPQDVGPVVVAKKKKKSRPE